MKNLLPLLACAALTFVMSGCASNSCSTPGLLPNQPIRNTFRSIFMRGEACNTCNPPVGQPNCGTNVAPLCNACGTGLNPAGQPAQLGANGQPISLYDNGAAPTYPTLGQPLTGQIGPVEIESMNGGANGSSNTRQLE